MRNLIAITLSLLIVLAALPAGAVIYSYKDENGRIFFVDDEQRIPAKYRGDTALIREQRDQPAPAEGTEGEKAEPEGEVYTDRATQMRAREQAQMLDRKRANQTPIMVRGNRVMVPVEVVVGSDTAHLILLLDTGATNTVLHRTAVTGLSFRPGTTIDANLAGGRKIKAEKVLTQHIDIGPFIIKDFPVMLINPQGGGLPYDGLLGMDFLRDHPYEINFDSEMIYWQPKP